MSFGIYHFVQSIVYLNSSEDSESPNLIPGRTVGAWIYLMYLTAFGRGARAIVWKYSLSCSFHLDKHARHVGNQGTLKPAPYAGTV